MSRLNIKSMLDFKFHLNGVKSFFGSKITQLSSIKIKYLQNCLLKILLKVVGKSVGKGLKITRVSFEILSGCI